MFIAPLPATIHPSLAPATPISNEITPHILQQCYELYFRQSLLKDYLGCPHRTLYRWIAGFAEESITMAAYLGTAGHKVIFDWHTQRRNDADQNWIMETFEAAFWEELNIRQLQPHVRAGCDSIREQLHEDMPFYVEVLVQYMKNKRNLEFHSMLHEQSFVLVVEHPVVKKFREDTANYQTDSNPHPADNVPAQLTDLAAQYPPYLFTGMLDQAGYYDDGTFVLRDIKFRDNVFRPSRQELSLDTQLTLYSAALKWGYPACNKCKPFYEQDQFSQARVLKYNGPCDACKAKIATPQWPLRYPERCELIWMYDFETYKKDQHTKEIPDRDAPKVVGPKGRKVMASKINPDWVKGYKKGDPKGYGILNSYRTPASLDVLLGDILRICDDIRAGRFYRRPSSQCNWCPHQEACQTSLKIQIDQIDYAKVSTFGTEDPF